jgi:hypothetical protein
VIVALAALAGGALAALVVVALVFASVVRSKDRQAARERDLLINQVMHLSGNTWSPPPAENGRREPVEPEPVVFVHPNQWPE